MPLALLYKIMDEAREGAVFDTTAQDTRVLRHCHEGIGSEHNLIDKGRLPRRPERGVATMSWHVSGPATRRIGGSEDTLSIIVSSCERQCYGNTWLLAVPLESGITCRRKSVDP